MTDEKAKPKPGPARRRSDWGDDTRALLHYDRFFELSFDLLCVAGFDGYFKLLSPSWTKTLGYTLDELYEQPFADFVHPDDREATAREAAKIADGAITIAFDNRYRTKDGRYLWLYWSAVPDMDQGVILAVARDITERKQLEMELREARDAAQQASQAKSEFLARMSHELRTPLNSVIGFSDVLLSGKGGGLTAVQEDYLTRVRTNGAHLLSLINQVLDLAKVEARKVEVELTSVDLVELAQSVVLQFDGQLQDRPITLDLELPEDPAPIMTDGQKLKQVLINLVGNAIKFTERGSVTLRVRADPDDPSRPNSIEVEDSGIGIPEESLATIFDSFEQVDHGTSRSFQGTGLGLAISQSLCELLGYELSVKSRVNEGTRFRIDLQSEPEADRARDTDPAKVSAARPAPADAADLQFSNKLVLVVDDDADARMLLTHALHELGCQVLTATSGEQGRRLAREHKPDLVTLDLFMPDVSGWDLLAEFRAEPALAKTPVVVVSSGAREEGALVIGAIDVLEKPVGLDEFRQVVARGLSSFRRRVLVVDDSADDQELLRNYLEEAGAEVLVAGSGREALERLSEFEPQMAVIDLMMPEMSGVELMARLRGTPGYEDLPTILVTARDLEGAELEALTRAAAAVIPKGPDLSTSLGSLLARLWDSASETPAAAK